MTRQSFYIVVYDDEGGLCIPMGQSSDCEGAIAASSTCVALFGDKRQARRAIRISTQYARLCREQGKPANDDFLGDGLKRVKVIPAVEVAK